MPTILVDIPKDAFPGSARAALVRGFNAAAGAAEQIPADPRQRSLCWVLVNEVATGGWICGGVDLTSQLLPCSARIYLPSGVLDETSRASYVQCVHASFEQALPADDRRRLVTSVLLQEVADGRWGVGGAVWTLADFARAAGFAHLQHLVDHGQEPR
ncbi:tautomerase [Variovorax ginsengisoli]|uniref:Tautomerase n=1 Tax=Variovorax ginsengisoli TaxID=363844 RepID=A0ABT8S037_9BURK|nr:tautomerase [Variovorax ginsengisoli]MDN8613099.1 tautomerase [Variovorax ginsengisoli]MDO1532269.1 tautomerase [Variovorax ginsengisoli]